MIKFPNDISTQKVVDIIRDIRKSVDEVKVKYRNEVYTLDGDDCKYCLMERMLELLLEVMEDNGDIC